MIAQHFPKNAGENQGVEHFSGSSDERAGGRRSYILEFKVQDSASGEKNLEDTCRRALQQIDEKNYDAQLLAEGFRKEQIRHYGFAFSGKNVLIRGEKSERA